MVAQYLGCLERIQTVDGERWSILNKLLFCIRPHLKPWVSPRIESIHPIREGDELGFGEWTFSRQQNMRRLVFGYFQRVAPCLPRQSDNQYETPLL